MQRSTQAFLSLLVLALAVRVHAVPLVAVDGWVVSDAGSSCDDVCNNNGLPACHLATLQAVTNVTAYKNILARLDNPFTCTGMSASKPYDHSPSFNTANGTCYYDGRNATCAGGHGLPSSVRRLCCCSATGCPLSLPVSCNVSSWGQWSSCSEANCNGGFQVRSRNMTKGPLNGGNCPSLTESRVCNEQPCVNGWQVADPNESCTEACAGKSPCSESGTDLITNSTQFQTVNALLGNPAVCSKFSPLPFYHSPSFLSGVCYIEGRTGTCDQRFTLGKRLCCCSTGDCQVDSSVQNCQVSQWSSWSAGQCSVSCGSGVQLRKRTVTKVPLNGGSACPVLVESQACNTAPCALDCKVSVWNAWQSCSAPCGGGQQTRRRTIVSDVKYGGAACPTELEQTQTCNTFQCPP